MAFPRLGADGQLPPQADLCLQSRHRSWRASVPSRVPLELSWVPQPKRLLLGLLGVRVTSIFLIWKREGWIH